MFPLPPELLIEAPQKCRRYQMCLKMFAYS